MTNKTKKVKWKGQNGVMIRHVDPRIEFKNVKTGDVLEVTEEQAKVMLRNPDFEESISKTKKVSE